MSAKWEDFLQEGSFKGVKFEFVSARGQGGNELDVQIFPGRNGARTEHRRRKELRIEVMAIFVEDDYPEKFFDVLNKCVEAGPGELVHPVYGSIQAAVDSYDESHDAEDGVDCGTIRITFLEHTENADQVFQNQATIAGKASEARSAADDARTDAAAHVEETLNTIANASSIAVAYASQAYADSVALQENCNAAANEGSIAADTLEQDGDEMTSAAIQSLVNGVLTKIDAAVTTLANYTTEDAYNLSRSLLALAAALGELANVLLNSKPPLIVDMVEADISLLMYAFAKYGDSSRVAELLVLNDFPDPLLIPAGTFVRRYAV